MASITEYRSPRILAYLAIVPLAGLLSIAILNIILGFGEIVLPREIVLDNGARGSAWFTIMYVLSLAELPLRVLAAIFFLVWLFRIFKNLGPTKVRNSEHPASWAIGVWFIPILNLFKPHQVMQQAWRDTDPDIDPTANYALAKPEFNSFILTWWIAYIASNVIARIGNRIAENLPDTKAALVIMIISFIAAAPALMAIQLVWEITRRQEDRSQKILNVHEDATPPPPPSFDG